MIVSQYIVLVCSLSSSLAFGLPFRLWLNSAPDIAKCQTCEPVVNNCPHNPSSGWQFFANSHHFHLNTEDVAWGCCEHVGCWRPGLLTLLDIGAEGFQNAACRKPRKDTLSVATFLVSVLAVSWATDSDHAASFATSPTTSPVMQLSGRIPDIRLANEISSPGVWKSSEPRQQVCQQIWPQLPRSLWGRC